MPGRERKLRGQPAGPVATLVTPVRPPRILFASHGHPRITRGGAENAAFALFEAFSNGSAYEAWFLGGRPNDDSSHIGVAITQPFGPREYVYTLGAFDWFKFANRDPSFAREFTSLLHEVQPDLIHLHHFAFFGLEAIWMAKRTLPNVKVILTAHEYLLICHAYGQMVTKQNNYLCHAASLDACHACFPEYSHSDFFLRREYAALFLPLLDAVIAPSAFLAARLRSWNVGVDRLEVMENAIAPRDERVALKPPVRADGPLRIGFFGQISRLKGIGVLLQAARLLAESGNLRITFDIHGKYEGQPPEFQAEFLEQLRAAGSNVRYHGSYRPEDVDRMMQDVSVVLVPSIWWENSPLVIQEAFRNRRPVICSDIGGMAEKVRPGLDGWHISVGDAVGLAGLLTALEGDRHQITAVSNSLRPPPALAETILAHRTLYEQVCGLRACAVSA